MGDVELPTLYFLEQVCLPDARGLRLIKDPNYNDFVYCKSDGGVFKIGVAGVVNSLANGGMLEDAECCKVDWIVNAISLSSTEKIKASVIVTDIFIGYTLLVFTPSQIVGVELLLKPTPFEYTPVENGDDAAHGIEAFNFEPKAGKVSRVVGDKTSYPEFVTSESLPEFCLGVKEARVGVVGLLDEKVHFERQYNAYLNILVLQCRKNR
jgi:hypothetical protein